MLPPALLAGEPISNPMVAFQAQADDVSSSEGHGSLWNQPAAKRNPAHQLPRHGAKAESARHDRSDLRFLGPEA